MQTPPPVFFFGEMVVGQFSDGAYPQRDGEVLYEPFRGPGHFQLQTALKATGRAACYFKRETERVGFEVVGCPRYGVLSICGLSNES